jgi:predicted RNA binding protein YcfA (HicA-like mRNA interferase family)
MYKMSVTMKRILIGVILIISLACLIIGFRIAQIVTTEKKPVAVLKCIINVEFNKKDVVELNDSSYLTKSDSKYIKSFLKNNGWKFEEQLGAGYSFKNSKGERLLLISRHAFGTRYLIFESNSKKIPVNIS